MIKRLPLVIKPKCLAPYQFVIFEAFLTYDKTNLLERVWKLIAGFIPETSRVKIPS